MPYDPVTAVFTRVSNSFSEPVDGTLILPGAATALFNDYDGGLSAIPGSVGSNAAPIVADGSQFHVQNSATTAEQIYNPLNSAVYFDTIRAATNVHSGSTNDNTAGIASYVLNNTAISGNVGAASAFFGIGISAVDNAATWGYTIQLQDSADNTVGGGVGRGLNTMEVDLTVFNTTTVVTGPTLLLGGQHQPTSSVGFAVRVGTDTDVTSGLPIQWAESFVSANGASAEALAVGAVSVSGTNVASQPINFYSFGPAGGSIVQSIQTANRSWYFKDAALANYLVMSNAATLNSPSFVAAGTDTNIDLTIAGKGTGNVIVSSVTNAGLELIDGTVTGLLLPTSILTHSLGLGTVSNHPLLFFTNNNSTTTYAELDTAGAWTWKAYGAGVVQSDASGVITSSTTVSGNIQFSGVIGAGIAVSTAAWLKIAAGTTAKSQINLPTSSAPSSPVDGDIWREDNTNTGLKIRVNGVTKTITLS